MKDATPIELVVVGKQSVVTHPLLRPRSITIGRGDDVDVQLDDPGVSRRHVTLHIGEVLEVEDLGSANGTSLSQVKLPTGKPVRFSLGEPIEVSGNLLIVQHHSSTGRRLHRLWTHGFFEARVEEECARAQRSGATFALVRLNIDGELSPATIEELLGSQLRTMDLLAAYRPGEYELLMVDVDPATASAATERFCVSLRKRGATVRVGIATFPHDGRRAEGLIAKAGEAVLGLSRVVDTGRIVVSDPSMVELYELAEKAARSPINVLILGETGTGKEVIAEFVHQHSPRAAKPFVSINCAALSQSLLESELFGHERGSFTGADRAKAGLIESAEGGTLVLDEVGELPLESQAKLLRVLEQREVLRVGGTKPRPIDVRFVSSTNAELSLEVQRGRFRRDLYFRLNGIGLVIPPLRLRPSEIGGLSELFAAQFAQASGKASVPRLSPGALAALQRYEWPGNIRELRNVIVRAVLVCEGSEILPEHLPMEKLSMPLVGTSGMPDAGPPPARVIDVVDAPPAPRATAPPSPRLVTTQAPPPALAEGERERIAAALAECAGNQTRAAVLLGMSRRTLTSRLTVLGFARPRRKR